MSTTPRPAATRPRRVAVLGLGPHREWVIAVGEPVLREVGLIDDRFRTGADIAQALLCLGVIAVLHRQFRVAPHNRRVLAVLAFLGELRDPRGSSRTTNATSESAVGYLNGRSALAELARDRGANSLVRLVVVGVKPVLAVDLDLCERVVDDQVQPKSPVVVTRVAYSRQ